MSEPMEPEAIVAPEEDVEALRSEVERLRAENERLAVQEKGGADHTARTRNGWAITIVIIGALLLALAVPAVWLNRVVFDTDTWVATVAPLADDPGIQAAVATAASNAIIEKLDAQARIKELLPDQLNLDQFASILAGSVESAIRTQATKFVQSDQFGKLWVEINRVSHKALITAITGREGALSIQAGTFTLDTGLLTDKIKAALTERGLGFVNKIPTSAIDQQIVLYQSDALAAAGPIVDLVQRLAFVIPVLGILLVGGRVRARGQSPEDRVLARNHAHDLLHPAAAASLPCAVQCGAPGLSAHGHPVVDGAIRVRDHLPRPYGGR